MLREIGSEVFRPDLGGTVTLEMVYFARKEGFRADWFSGETIDITGSVDRGDPLIVMVDYGFNLVSKNHFMVVVGYSPEGVIVLSGLEKDKLIPWKDFLNIWRRAGNWTLRIGESL